MADRLVALMYESWRNLDTVIDGLSDDEMTAQPFGGSSIAWSVGHVTNMTDSWLNVRFQGLAPNPVVSHPNFRTGGTGRCGDWPELRDAVAEVRPSGRRFLDGGPDLGFTIPYDGSIAFLRSTGLTLWYAVARIAAHHLMHMGEIEALRTRMGRPVVDNGGAWGRGMLG